MAEVRLANQVEYIAASKATKEAVWMKIYNQELSVVPSIVEPVFIFYDNNEAIAQAKEPKSHHRSKHILRCYHLISDKSEYVERTVSFKKRIHPLSKRDRDISYALGDASTLYETVATVIGRIGKGGSYVEQFGVALGTRTSVLAELTAVWWGLELGLTHGLALLVVGVDTTAVISLLQSHISRKWGVQHLIMRIVRLQQLLVADIQHVFREANGAADHLAKEAASLQLTRVLHHNDITGVLRGILCLDRWESSPSLGVMVSRLGPGFFFFFGGGFVAGFFVKGSEQISKGIRWGWKRKDVVGRLLCPITMHEI
ncbi:UNVERIFIED_CONTAM: hypothetical protein Scaly_2219500 [Sesamum calycinum]|uniref:RNase H type-1 domain-containing protein n=1 Tax=Sesamum calycinum TaxID=2727403 RepID=A0AAW2M8W7_9LAMI